MYFLPLNTEIKRLRLLKGIPPAAVAVAAGVSVATIERWEKGLFCPKASQLMALAKLFGVTETELLHPKEDEEENRVS